MTYTIPSLRADGYLIKADVDWNILVADVIDLEARISALELGGGVTSPTNVPVNGIIIWNGTIGSVPANWALCDGSSGTPDLRDRFVIGAGSTYAVGDTGGSITHTHSGGSTGTNGAHDHTATSSTGVNSGTATAVSGAGTTVASNGHSHGFSLSTNSTGNHSHSGGTTGSASSLPLYYALCFIMRTS